MYTKTPIKILNRFLSLFYDKLVSYVYSKQYRKTYKAHSFKNDETITATDIRMYKQKWESLSRCIDPVYLKIFSRYIGKDYRITPEDVVHNVIEALLNPIEHRGPYSDKNMYDKLLNQMPDCLPRTYFRRIDGHFYDNNYNNINDTTDKILELEQCNGVVAKVTVDTSSGLGVKLFGKTDGILLDKTNGELLSLEYLNETLGRDYIVQEYLSQSTFMSSFNKTSINTLRILVYRSVNDNKVHVLNTILRIGKDGSLMDNAHQGGAVVGVKPNGELQNYLVDQFGNHFVIFNGIDFSREQFVIPNWDEIVHFATKIGENIMYHRLLNLDVMIDSNNVPKLIEFNIRSMGIWSYQYAIGSCFGEFTDEIIEYCAANKDKIKSEYLLL